MGRRNRGMYQNGRRDGREGMDGMHFDIIPFALTPSPRKVPLPRKVPSPRKLFSNYPVPCGPAPPIPPIEQFYFSAWSTLDAPGAHLKLYMAEGKLLHQNLNTFKYMPGQTGRAAGPASHPVARAGVSFCRAHRPSTNTRKPFGNVLVFIHFQFFRGGRRS